MKNIMKTLGLFGAAGIIFATGYFIKLYIDLTQLIFSLGIAGLLILAAFLYVYNWMVNKDELYDEFGHSLDMNRDYIREVEGKIK